MFAEPPVVALLDVKHFVTAMDELCFIIVDGITTSMTSSEEKSPIIDLLRGWFPKSHYHSYNPFTKTVHLVDDSNIVEELGRSLLENTIQCPDCSVVYQGPQQGPSELHSYRPVVFLGHDLGGSVIKRALLLASEDSSYQRIAKATVAIVFFGTPHRADTYNPWERQLISLLSVSKRSVEGIFTIVHGLPLALTAIAQSFTGISGSYVILNVYENSGTATITKHSATLDSFVGEHFGSDRSHHQLLNVQEEGDPVAEWLLRKLTVLTERSSTTNDEYHKFVRYLTQMEPMLHELETKPFFPGSLNWVTKLKSFQEWQNSGPGISFLHIFGPAGSGVTVLTSNIVWIHSEMQAAKGICYLKFSFNKQNIMASTARNVVLSLVSQLLSSRPSLFKHAYCLCTWMMKKRCINVEILWVLFESLLSHIGKEPVLVAIRAIQECNPPGEESAIISRLLALRRAPDLNMKIIVTSETPDWAERYRENFYGVPIKEIGSVSDALKEIVRRRVQRLVQSRPAWRDLGETLTETLWNPEMNYYLAMAKVQELEMESRTIRSTENALRDRLEGFQCDSQHFFKRMFRKITLSSQGWIREALHWIVFALRPLTAQELAIAVAFKQGEDNVINEMSMETLEEKTFSDLPGDINRLSGYWIKVRGGRVEITNPELTSFLIENFMENEYKVHEQMLRKCLGYLSWARQRVEFGEANAAKRHEADIGDRRALRLLDYAALYWPFHFRRVGDLRQYDIEMVDRFLTDAENLRFWSGIIRNHGAIGSTPDFSISPLKTVAMFGLIDLVDRFAPASEALREADNIRMMREAMDLATDQGHTNVVLKLSDKIRDSGLAPHLHKVAEKGNLELLKSFLEIPSVKESINDTDTLGYTALHYSAQYGQRGSVNLLLLHGAEPNLTTDDGSTALHLASKIGELNVVQGLIENGADYQICDTVGHNPVQLAAQGGFVDLLNYLVPLYSDKTDDQLGPTTTPLHLAARYGHTLACTRLIQFGAAISTFDENGMTPVHLAVLANFVETVKTLIELAPVPSASNRTEEVDKSNQESLSTSDNADLAHDHTTSSSPLQLAAEMGFVDSMKLLIEHSYFHQSLSYDCTEAISLAAVQGQWRSIEKLLEYISERNAIDMNGDSALHKACEHGHVILVDKLLESGQYDPDFPNKAGMSALHIAALNGQVRIITTLLEKGTSVDSAASNGDKAIHFAAKQGHLQVVKGLQQIKNMATEKGNSGKTPILVAAMEGHTTIVEELLSTLNRSEESLENLWGELFPLHQAVSSGNRALVSILISHGCEMDSIDIVGEAPLHIAARIGSVEMIQSLIQSGANVSVKAGREYAETPLCIAASNGKVHVCSAIFEAAPEKIADYVDIPDSIDDTPLYRACSSGYKEVVQLLLQHKADPNRCCSSGWTPLHEAAMRDNTDIMEMLFAAGADHSVKNTYQSTPIVLAAENGNENAMRLLLERNASATVINKTGSSALHRAAQGGHLECVKLLVEAKADINSQKTNGLTPLHMAVANAHETTVKYLVEIGANVNLKSDISGTPLHLVMESRSFDPDGAIVQTLISAYATTTWSATQISDLTEEAFLFAVQHPKACIFESPGETLQLAISKGYEECALKMIETEVGIHETGGEFHIALQAAAAAQSIDIMEKLLEKKANPNVFGGSYGSALNAATTKNNVKAVALLLDKEAKPITKDKNNRPLLSYAMHCNSAAVVDYLLNRPDIPFHEADHSLRTPLMTAVMLSRHDVVKRLLEMKADPNTQDSEDKTPLIRAITSPALNMDLITTLLDKGANPSVEDCRGRGALYWACLSGNPEKFTVIEKLLLPLFLAKRQQSLGGELAFHAAASLTAESTLTKQQATLDTLLRGKAKLELEEKDNDGWTATYTATRFGLAGVEESLVQAMILHGFARQSVDLQKPTAWHQKDKAPCLHVSGGGLSVSVRDPLVNPNDRSQPFATIRADHCMPGDCVYYFEVTIDKGAHKGMIGIGFCEEHTPLDRIVGWDAGSWGYHGDDGKTYGSTHSNKYDTKYGEGVTIGCGVNFVKQTAFFTKDGEPLGPAFRNIKGKLYPAVSFSSERATGAITANFGKTSFKYNNWESDMNTVELSPKQKTLVMSDGYNYDDSDESDFEWEVRRRR